MGFGDLKSESGVKVLNEYLADKSYIDGFQPSQADVAVFESLRCKPAADFNHALRWWNHVDSYGNERTSFVGEKTTADAFGPISGSGTAAATEKADDEDDDDIDLFGSDEEDDAEAEKLKQERIAAYTSKKSNKPVLIAKSSILLDIKPWDDETDMNEMERLVRTVECDGLLWCAAKFVPIAYGVKKLVINCVVVDDKVGTDFLEEEITKFEDYVQSVDVAAFNKI